MYAQSMEALGEHPVVAGEPKADAIAAAGGGVDAARLLTLQKRFPNASGDEIKAALSETHGHAGQAAGILAQLKAETPNTAEAPPASCADDISVSDLGAFFQAHDG